MKITSQRRVAIPGFYYFLNISIFPLALLLVIIKFVLRIQFVRVKNARMGPLAGTELFLRRLKLNRKKYHFTYVGIASTKTANKQFLTMLRRKIKIILIPQPTIIRIILRLLATDSILPKLGLLEELKFVGYEYAEFNRVTNCIEFTTEEKLRGEKLLEKLGLSPKDWFICFYARDQAYLDDLLKKRDSRHDFRNCDINKFLNAARFIARRGGYALRMGAKVEKPLTFSSQKIIDYASASRSDFGDIYLSSHCKFFLASSAGLIVVPYVFNIPVASVNVIPLLCGIPVGKTDLFIPKKIWSRKENRFLTFKEIIYSKELEFWQERGFRKEDDPIPIENTAQEILDLAIEMNGRVDGTWKTTAEDEELQRKFKALYPQNSPYSRFPSRIGAKFLQENKHLLV